MYKLILPDDWKPPWWRDGDPLEYDLRDGCYDKTYDLVTENLPGELVERIYECMFCLTAETVKWSLGRKALLRRVGIWASLPLGLDRSTIFKHGATLEC